jgi:phosphate transport system permease protein
MQTTTVVLVLVALSILSFTLGQRRSRALAQVSGGIASLHSLPKHYGYMASLWAALPALLVLVLWLSFESSVLFHLTTAELPQEVLDMHPSELGLYYNQVVGHATGRMGVEQLDEAQIIAAVHYRGLLSYSNTLKALMVFLVAVLGGALAIRRIAPTLRARKVGAIRRMANALPTTATRNTMRALRLLLYDSSPR